MHNNDLLSAALEDMNGAEEGEPMPQISSDINGTEEYYEYIEGPNGPYYSRTTGIDI